MGGVEIIPQIIGAPARATRTANPGPRGVRTGTNNSNLMRPISPATGNNA